MIVVAIIGILAAIAIPTYNDYTIRAKVSEILAVADRDKTSASEVYLSNGTFPVLAAGAGVSKIAAVSQYLSAINYLGDGADYSATNTYTVANISAAVNGTTVVFTGTGSTNGVLWTCDAGDLPPQYLPAACR